MNQFYIFVSGYNFAIKNEFKNHNLPEQNKDALEIYRERDIKRVNSYKYVHVTFIARIYM